MEESYKEDAKEAGGEIASLDEEVEVQEPIERFNKPSINETFHASFRFSRLSKNDYQNMIVDNVPCGLFSSRPNLETNQMLIV